MYYYSREYYFYSLVCILDDAYNDTMMGSARITLHSSRSHFNLR